MKDLAIKAVATSPGGFYYREEHEWRGMDSVMSGWFEKKLSELQAHVDRVNAKKDDGDIVATFVAVIDGQTVPSVSAVGITRKEMSKFQRMFHNVGDELIRIGEGRAEKKDKEHKK